MRWVNDGKLLYADKEKALNYFSVSAPIAEAQNNQELESATKIIQDFENQKLSEGATRGQYNAIIPHQPKNSF